MPSQSRSGVRGVPWSRCDMCGYDYPLDRMQMQGGILRCVEKCVDSTGSLAFAIKERDDKISMVLGQGTDAPNMTAIKRSEDDGNN